VDILSSLLERPTIGRDFEPNYATMMRLLDAQLNHVKRLYDDQMALYVDSGAMPIHRNMAPVSGSLKWAHELRDRITIPMNEFRRLDHPYARGVARSFSPVRLLVAYKSRRNATLQYTLTHTRLTALCPGLPGWASTRKVKPIWILLKREAVSGIGWAGPYAILQLAPNR